MQSDALQKIRFALQYIEVAAGSEFFKLKEAYLRWLTNINESALPPDRLVDFRRLMREMGELVFLDGACLESRAVVLIAELKRLETGLAAG